MLIFFVVFSVQDKAQQSNQRFSCEFGRRVKHIIYAILGSNSTRLLLSSSASSADAGNFYFLFSPFWILNWSLISDPFPLGELGPHICLGLQGNLRNNDLIFDLWSSISNPSQVASLAPPGTKRARHPSISSLTSIRNRDSRWAFLSFLYRSWCKKKKRGKKWNSKQLALAVVPTVVLRLKNASSWMHFYLRPFSWKF